jgi:putative transposase
MSESVPPKYALANVIGYTEGKSAVPIAKNFAGKRRDFTEEHFWARGYYVSKVGLDEESVRNESQRQETKDERLEQLNLYQEGRPPSGGL